MRDTPYNLYPYLLSLTSTSRPETVLASLFGTSRASRRLARALRAAAAPVISLSPVFGHPCRRHFPVPLSSFNGTWFLSALINVLCQPPLN